MSWERGVMSSEEADHVSPWEVTPTVGKGTLGTWRFSRQRGWPADKTGVVAGRCPGDEAVGKPRSQGVCEPALEPWRRGKGLWKKAKTSNRTGEIPPSGIIETMEELTKAGQVVTLR